MLKKTMIIAATIVFMVGCKEGVSKERLENGKKIYLTYCQSCHMDDGSGVPRLNAPLINSAYVSGDKQKLINIVLKGSAVFANEPARSYTNTMPSMASLGDEPLADVLTFIRNNFQNTGDPVSVAEVRAEREKMN
jgi:mono/diheme cytochrome c family protein